MDKRVRYEGRDLPRRRRTNWFLLAQGLWLAGMGLLVTATPAPEWLSLALWVAGSVLLVAAMPWLDKSRFMVNRVVDRIPEPPKPVWVVGGALLAGATATVATLSLFAWTGFHPVEDGPWTETSLDEDVWVCQEMGQGRETCTHPTETFVVYPAVGFRQFVAWSAAVFLGTTTAGLASFRLADKAWPEKATGSE